MSFRSDAAKLVDHGKIGAGVRAADGLRWMCHTLVEKYEGGIDAVRAGLLTPVEVLSIEGNALLLGGADVMWLGMKGSLSASTGLKNTLYNNANAAILVGKSTAAVVTTQVDLQASSGSTARFVKGMDATFPTHTTGTTGSTSSKILYKATFSTAQANFAWREWGIGNRVSQAVPYSGRLLNRKVQNLGTKTSAGVWALTLTLTLA